MLYRRMKVNVSYDDISTIRIFPHSQSNLNAEWIMKAVETVDFANNKRRSPNEDDVVKKKVKSGHAAMS